MFLWCIYLQLYICVGFRLLLGNFEKTGCVNLEVSFLRRALTYPYSISLGSAIYFRSLFSIEFRLDVLKTLQ